MSDFGEWATIKLGDLVEGYRGVSYQPHHLLDSYDKDTVILLRANNIQQGRLQFEDIQIVPKNLVKKVQYLSSGDVAVCMSNGSKHLVGKSAQLVDEINLDCTIGAFCSVFRPREGADHNFVKQLFLSSVYQAHIDLSLAGSAINNLKNSDIESIIFKIPSKAKQKKIATILETIDQAIGKTEALMEKYQHIKAGLMHDLFTRGIAADGKLRPPIEQAPELYQETPIGWIPKAWNYELLDKLTERGSGHTPNKSYPNYWNGGIKWISLSDSRRLDNLYISDSDLEISELGIQNSSATMHQAGIVVMSRDAGVGKSAITTQPMAVSQHFMVWKCGAKMDNHFLYYWLQFNKRTFENIAMGSTIVTIGLPYFKRLRISAPIEKTEQTRIGDRLKKIDSYIFSLKADFEKLKQQKSGLMHDLLTGKVQVSIDNTEAKVSA